MTDGNVVKRSDVEDTPRSSQFWQLELKAAEDREKTWRQERAPLVVRRYRDEDREHLTGNTKRTNILWANTEILRAALLQAVPTPDVRRRFGTADKVGRSAATVLERGISYSIDDDDYEDDLEQAVEDALLPGRGSVWVVYDPEISKDDQGTEEITNQIIKFEYVYWEDYREGRARSWKKVPWIARRHLMTRKGMQAAKFEDADKLPLNHTIEPGDRNQEEVQGGETFKRGEVWEIWDKSRKERVWVMMGQSKVLRIDRDPYELEGFFPCAEPFTPNGSNLNRTPIPLFTLYQDQAMELDVLTNRINKLVAELKWRGVYDEAEKENAGLANLAIADDGTWVGVKNWAAFAGKGGLQGTMQAMPLETIIQALNVLYVQRDNLISAIFQLTGISDIVRGSTDPNETKGAQVLKSQFANMRISRLLGQMTDFIRETYRISAEIIAEHFEPERLEEMTQVDLPFNQEIQAQAQPLIQQVQQAQAGLQQITQIAQQAQQTGVQVPQQLQQAGQQQAQQLQQQGQQLQAQLEELNETVTWEKVMEVLRNDDRRSYHVDVETSNSALIDEQAEKSARLEFVTTMTDLMTNLVPGVQQNPTIAPFAKELVLFASRAWKIGRTMEETLEDAFDQISQQANQPQQDAEAQAAQAEAAAKQQEMQMKVAETQIDAQVKQQKMENETAQTRADIKNETLKTTADVRLSNARADNLNGS